RFMGEEKTFKALFCEIHRCPPEKFARRLFWAGLHRRALPFAKLLMLIKPRFFALDFQLVEEAGSSVAVDEFVSSINCFREDCKVEGSFLHEDLQLRISGKRLLDVYKRTKKKAYGAHTRTS